MKTYLITVNGVSYEVAVEEMGASAATMTPAGAAVLTAPKAAATPVAAASAAAAPKAAPAPKPAAAPSGSGTVIAAPIPGTILDIKVQVGSKVKAGDLILILEAMKMENEIVAENDCTIKAIFVNKGDSVNSGDPMVEVQ
ncbi:MAG: biotin/lipoyl-binding protein [Negativicutes bacterium]|nr:biotin/lipoyl-binding protein [Negativicutes bacterium]